jgi:cystathionine gamma-synthase
MHSVSSDSSLQTYATCHDVERIPPAPWDSDASNKDKIKALIAKFITSQKQGETSVRPQDVFLYPKGMCAIGSVARQIVPTSTPSSEAVIFG